MPNGKLVRLLVDDEPFDVRDGPAARPRAHPRLPRRHPAPRGGVDIPGRPAGADPQHPAGLLQPARRAGHPVRGGAGRAPARIVLQSELLANEPLPDAGGDSGADDAVPTRLMADGRTSTATRACLMHRTRRSGLRLAAAVDHLVTADAGSSTPELDIRRGLGPAHRPRRPRARSAAGADQVRRVRVVGRAVGDRAPGPGRRGADRRRGDRLGRAGGGPAGATSTSSGRAPTSRWTATRRCSRRCGSGCSTCCRPAPGPSSGRSRPRA